MESRLARFVRGRCKQSENAFSRAFHSFPLQAIGGAAGKGLTSSFMQSAHPNPEPELADLFEKALDAARNSYSPYSGFRVGAALQLTSGEIFTGTNVENVSYGLTICAERAALATAVSQLGPGIRIAAVAVANLNQAPSPPCGACRQVLAEFILPTAPVLFPVADGSRTMAFAELLPLAFDLKLKDE
jgi:homotetrameric cytidine deaminase